MGSGHPLTQLVQVEWIRQTGTNSSETELFRSWFRRISHQSLALIQTNIWKSQIMQAYSNSIILNDVWLTRMVPDCFIMSDAPYYLDICIVHNLYPSPSTLPLPLPLLFPQQTKLIVSRQIVQPVLSHFWMGGTLVSWHFPRGLNLPLYPPSNALPLPPPFPPTNKTHWFSTNGATRIVPFLNGGKHLGILTFSERP